MAATIERESATRRLDASDLPYTGPGTPAGQFLRRFWQPIYRGEDLPAGRAIPLRLMSEDFTLYRGESGQVHLVAFRCAHRGTQLSTGWVEGDNVRCFYHGWAYDGNGQCVEQPAEPQPFCERIRIRSYPVQEYLGVIFVYMGEGDPPPLQRFRGAESATLRVIETAVFPFNFWNSLDNKQDYAHLPFVHNRGHANGFDLSRLASVTFTEADWGYTSRQSYPDGHVQIEHLLMPNGYLHKARPGNPRPEDPESGWRDTIRWTVPIDDEHHRDISLYLSDATPEQAERYLARRAQTLAAMEPIDQMELVYATLGGQMSVDELAAHKVPQEKTADSVARLGQGVIADRSDEHLGYTDRSLMLYRRLWLREMQALLDGRPLKEWRCPEDLLASWE